MCLAICKPCMAAFDDDKNKGMQITIMYHTLLSTKQLHIYYVIYPQIIHEHSSCFEQKRVHSEHAEERWNPRLV